MIETQLKPASNKGEKKREVNMFVHLRQGFSTSALLTSFAVSFVSYALVHCKMFSRRLASTRWIPVAPASVTFKKMFPDTAKYLLGEKSKLRTTDLGRSIKACLVKIKITFSKFLFLHWKTLPQSTSWPLSTVNLKPTS